jgi:hypothetical protein
MIITLYLHANKESAWEEAERAGLTGEALNLARFLGYEHKMEYEVDQQTGEGELVRVDGRQVLAAKE